MSAHAVSMALTGRGVLVTGVEDEPTGGVRVYIGARYEKRYLVVTDPEDVENVRREWRLSYRGHLLIDRDNVPWDAVQIEAERGGA